MSKGRANTVQIVNPLPQGAQYTSYKTALQFVRRGLAVFEGSAKAIRFLDQDRRIDIARGGDQGDGHFGWRIGKTSGFTQRMGSIFYPMDKGRRLDKPI